MVNCMLVDLPKGAHLGTGAIVYLCLTDDSYDISLEKSYRDIARGSTATL